MPENLTRREFLKDLGLMGAGVTLAPLAADGDALDSFRERLEGDWKPGPAARPSWVKATDKPTIEIDWDKMQRFDERNTCRAGFVKYVGQERLDKLVQIQTENVTRYLKENRPGYTLKDLALKDASSTTGTPMSFLGPKSSTPPDKRGVPAWTGSPEDAAHIVNAALRQLGAAMAGFVELDSRTTEKFIYSVDPDGKELVFADVDQAAEEEKRRVIPKKARWVIVYGVQRSEETTKRYPTPLGSAATMMGYRRGYNIQARLQDFLRGLGYMGLGGAVINAIGIAPAFAVMAGLGEMGRFNRLVTPEYGPNVGVFIVVTDLPLAPTKPINAGIMEFCKICMKCAAACPSKALSFDAEPTWQVRGGWNNAGHKAYFEDSSKCRSYWYEVGSDCTLCFNACPYSRKDKAFMHALQGAGAAYTPAFNPVLKSLDDAIYGAPDASGKSPKDPASWWSLDLPEYGIDTTRAKRDMV